MALLLPQQLFYGAQVDPRHIVDLTYYLPGLRRKCMHLVSLLEAKVYRADGKEVLVAANVGDARVVLAKAGKAIQLTFDHKVVSHFNYWELCTPMLYCTS